MINQTLAREARLDPQDRSGALDHVGAIVPRALGLSARIQRGIDLVQARPDEITCVLAPSIWSVPAFPVSGVYIVDLEHGECSCPDRLPEGGRCAHFFAAAYANAMDS